jgi:hypothetical protein
MPGQNVGLSTCLRLAARVDQEGLQGGVTRQGTPFVSGRKNSLAGLARARDGQDREAPAQALQSLAGLAWNHFSRLATLVQIGNLISNVSKAADNRIQIPAWTKPPSLNYWTGCMN